MSCRICILLLLLSTTCHSQENIRPTTPDKFAQLHDDLQRKPSTPQPTPLPPYFAPATPGTISVVDLQLSPKASRELLRSQKAFQSGDWQASASHLEKLLAIDPQYWPARNSLGRLYVGLHAFDRAAQQFQQASATAPHSAEPLNNLAATLVLLERYPEAERVARATLDLDPTQVEAHYILGCTLIAQEHFTSEAEEQLRLSTSRIPVARLLLATLLSHRGAREQAAVELRAYLQIPDAPEKQEAQSALARLTRGSPNLTTAAALSPK